jgi:hypothetical protein
MLDMEGEVGDCCRCCCWEEEKSCAEWEGGSCAMRGGELPREAGGWKDWKCGGEPEAGDAGAGEDEDEEVGAAAREPDALPRLT